MLIVSRLPKLFRRCAAALCCGVLGWAATLAWSQAPAPNAPATVSHLRVVGGLAELNQYVRREEPFWTRELARLSGGRYTAEIVPFDRAGVPGTEMLRLLQLGVVPLGTALMSSFSAQHPEYTPPIWRG